MDLTQLANLGEFIGGVGSAVGAIAVLATLIYLAVQVRQNTAAIRASSAQAFGDSVNGINFLIAGDLEQARVWRLAMEDPEALTVDERTCADWMCLAACRTFDTGLLHAELGSLDREIQETIFQGIRDCFAMDFYREWWCRNPISLSGRLERFVEDECGVTKSPAS